VSTGLGETNNQFSLALLFVYTCICTTVGDTIIKRGKAGGHQGGRLEISLTGLMYFVIVCLYLYYRWRSNYQGRGV